METLMESKENGRRTPNRLPTINFLPGKRNFYCNKERLMCYFILFWIVISYFAIMINDSVFITEKFTFLAPTLFSIVFLSTVLNQLLASFSNPGVVQPQDYNNDRGPLEPPACITLEKTQGQVNEKERQTLVPVKMNGNIVNLKFCKTCKLIRPLRASHCKQCDVCIYRFDHHCPYLANCVGLKNYKNYYYFLFSVVLYTTLGFLFAFLHILDASNGIGSFRTALESSPASIVIMAACFTGGVFPLGLLCFHTYVLVSGTTTSEMCKDTFKGAGNPYRSRNPFQNCYTILCRTEKPKNIFELIY